MENPILYLVHDLNFVLKLCNEQIEKKEYRSYIISSNRTFLDYKKLQSNLININPTNYLRDNLKGILITALKIIELDFQLEEIEKITIEKDLHNTLDFGEEYGFISSCFPIKCYTIDEFRVLRTNLTTQQNRDSFIKRSVSANLISFDNKKEFENHYKHIKYDSNDFAKKCSHIVQIVTGFFGLRTEDEMNEFLKSKETTQPESTIENKNNKNTNTKKQKQLTEYFINLTNVNEFLIELTQTFTTEKGKSIKFIIDELIKTEILVIPDRKMTNFIGVLQKEFSQNIGNVSGINREFYYDKLFSEPILKKLNPLIIKHKKTT